MTDTSPMENNNEDPLQLFDEVLQQLSDWKWERWSQGTSAEFQARLDADTKALRDRMEDALERYRQQVLSE